MTNQEEVYMSKLANSQMVKVCVCVYVCVYARVCFCARVWVLCAARVCVRLFCVHSCVCFAGDCRTLCSGCEVSLRGGVHSTNRFVREIWSPGAEG